MTNLRMPPVLWLLSSLILSLLGVAAFVVLFVMDFNIYWLILSPVIFAMYQLPAIVLFWIWKRKKEKEDGSPQ